MWYLVYFSTSSTSLSTDEKESAHQVAVDVKCLQILRALIHNELCKGRSGSNKDRYIQSLHTGQHQQPSISLTAFNCSVREQTVT